MFSPLYVFEQDISKSYGRIWMKLGGQVWCVIMMNQFDVGDDPDTSIFFNDPSQLRDRPKSYEISKCYGRIKTKLGGCVG